MSESWQSTQAGRHLAGRRKRDTAPEMRLRSSVHRRGLRYAVQKRLAKGCTPDLLLVSRRLAVFVDGCFWHGCPAHGRSTFSGPNADLWVEKMRRNKERDARADRLARDAGFRVLRLWECEVMADAEAAASRVVAEAQGPRDEGDPDGQPLPA